MHKSLMLPVGIESFEEIRKNRFYYIDKTRLIEHLFYQRSKVSLFTRPRRFGKSLNMSMLKSFFELGADRSLFDGLYISKRKDLCDTYFGKYPVILISLKDISASTFDEAVKRMAMVLGREFDRFSFLSNSPNLVEKERERYKILTRENDGLYVMDRMLLISSLRQSQSFFLSIMDKRL